MFKWTVYAFSKLQLEDCERIGNDQGVLVYMARDHARALITPLSGGKVEPLELERGEEVLVASNTLHLQTR